MDSVPSEVAHTAELLARATGTLPSSATGDALGITTGNGIGIGPRISPIKHSAVLPPPLSPSPRITESSKPLNEPLSPTPFTPRRQTFSGRLSLQTGTANLDLSDAIPLSPQLDQTSIFASVPRRTRGYDFSRSCTNLHHSILATEPSPDVSPTITNRGLVIPKRSSMIPNSGMDLSIPWGAERSGISSSIGSVSMLDSGESAGSSSEDEDLDAGEDTMVMTPQVNGFTEATTPFLPKDGLMKEPPNPFSPAAASLMNYQRSRIQKRRNSKSFFNRRLEVGSPSPSSPPIRNMELGANGYFSGRANDSRRSSLSLGTNALHISSEGDSDESLRQHSEAPMPTTPKEERTRIVKKFFAKRANMMPKPKNFARIRATLQQEKAPADMDVRHEAEIMRQVYFKPPEETWTEGALSEEPTPMSASSDRPPAFRKMSSLDFDLDDDMAGGSSSNGSERGYSETFSEQVKRHSRGAEFWDSFENITRTPPSSRPISKIFSTNQDELHAQLGQIMENSKTPNWQSQTPTSSSYAIPSEQVTRRLNTKRRRDDDGELEYIKRRAVSPGPSSQNSPILAQSPAHKDGYWMGTGNKRDSGAGKRVGLQGMSDAGDAIMKMHIG